MDLSLFGRRRFRHPYLGTSETVGPTAMLWSFIGGPLYYWKKGARIEAALFGAVAISLYFYDPHSAIIDYATVYAVVTAVWLGSIVGAPILLRMSYLRRGWDEAGAEESMPTEAEAPALRARRRTAYLD